MTGKIKFSRRGAKILNQSSVFHSIGSDQSSQFPISVAHTTAPVLTVDFRMAESKVIIIQFYPTLKMNWNSFLIMFLKNKKNYYRFVYYFSFKK